MRTTKKLAAMIGGMAMTAGLLVGGATTAGAATPGEVSAQACLDYAVTFSKPAGYSYYPTSSTSRLTTSGNCADINLRITNGSRYVKVCFYPSSGGAYCQSSWTYVTSTWNEVATNVADGTKYRFQFASSALATGQYAD